MRSYDYTEKWKTLLTPEIVKYLTLIHEYKGEQQFMEARHADILESMVETAKIQSAGSSNRIEGVFASRERLKKIVAGAAEPGSRDEQEIAGYRDVLNTIDESSEYIPVKSPLILQLHRDLYKFENTSIGGVYKAADNVIQETDADGNAHIRFSPIPAWETPESMERLCGAYQDAVGRGEADPLLLMSMFVLDFLCIHPFADGNGRMSRLLTLLILYKAGFCVGRYISIEKLIEATKDDYYAALRESSKNWHAGENDYAPFVRYMLGIVAAAYREFFDRTKWLGEKAISKPDRVREEVRDHYGTIKKSDLLERLPDISETTVQHTLAYLVKTGEILKIGGGRYTKYSWNREEDSN